MAEDEEFVVPPAYLLRLESRKAERELLVAKRQVADVNRRSTYIGGRIGNYEREIAKVKVELMAEQDLTDRLRREIVRLNRVVAQLTAAAPLPKEA